MENVSDALIMAGQVLIFIVALTVCMSSFSTLRIGIDNIISQTETIEFAKDDDVYINLIESRDEGATRIVGAETVIASMYRSIKENYTMYILFTKASTFNEVKNLGNKIANYEVKFIDEPTIKGIKITIGNDANFIPDTLARNGLYSIIKNEEFYEYLGEYQDNTLASRENKLTNRIITYEQKN